MQQEAADKLAMEILKTVAEANGSRTDAHALHEQME